MLARTRRQRRFDRFETRLYIAHAAERRMWHTEHSGKAAKKWSIRPWRAYTAYAFRSTCPQGRLGSHHFLYECCAALSTARLRQTSHAGVFYNTFACRMPANKGVFNFRPARTITSGYALSNVGPRRFTCRRKGRTVVFNSIHTGSSEAKEEEYCYHCCIINASRCRERVGGLADQARM